MDGLRFFLLVFPIFSLFISCDKSYFKIESNATEKSVLRIWEGDKGGTEFLQSAANVYGSYNGDVDFLIETVEPSEVLYQLSVDLPKGDAADVFCVTSDIIPYLVENNLIQEIKNFSFAGKDVLYPCAEDSYYDGKIYGIPVSLETNLLFYNRSLINEKEVPETWGDMMAKCRKFNIKNLDKRALVFNVRDSFVTSSFMSLGKRGIFQRDSNNNVSICREPFVDFGVDFFKRFRIYFDIDSDEANSEFARDMFRNGRAAMIITDSSDVRIFEDAPVNFGATILPSYTSESEEGISSYRRTRVMVISSSTKFYDHARGFACSLLATDLQQKRLSLTGAYPAVSLDIKGPVAKASRLQLEKSIGLPSNTKMPEIWKIMDKASGMIWDGYAGSGILDELSQAVLKVQALENSKPEESGDD